MELATLNPENTVYLFDFDGTLTRQELLPLIAEELGCFDEIQDLTLKTLNGEINFFESFRRRVEILSSAPLSLISDIISRVELRPCFVDFITANSSNCKIVTGNLDLWINDATKTLGVEVFSSKGIVKEDGTVGISQILDKSTIAARFSGMRTIMFGDSANDASLMRRCDVGIAVGIAHLPPHSILEVCSVLILSEKQISNVIRRL